MNNFWKCNGIISFALQANMNTQFAIYLTTTWLMFNDCECFCEMMPMTTQMIWFQHDFLSSQELNISTNDPRLSYSIEKNIRRTVWKVQIFRDCLFNSKLCWAVILRISSVLFVCTKKTLNFEHVGLLKWSVEIQKTTNECAQFFIIEI